MFAPYVVFDQPDEDVPVYNVKPENRIGRIRRLHRKKLYPFSALPAPFLESADRENTKVIV